MNGPDFDSRRAAEERRKAEAAPSPRVRDGHLALAEIFEARAAQRGKGGKRRAS
jgi:hypothetical protein